jgi:vacuolar-type H+-ATPase subunit H
MAKNLEIGKICFLIDQKLGPIPAIVEELVERKTRMGSEFFYVFSVGGINNRRKMTERELEATKTIVIATIEEVKDYLLNGAKEWVDDQCAQAEQKAFLWYQDLFENSESQISSGVSDTSSILEQIVKAEEETITAKAHQAQQIASQDDGPEIKMVKPKGRPPKKGNE